MEGVLSLFDWLTHEALLFGVLGGVVVSILVWILRSFNMVGPGASITTPLANFGLSVLFAGIVGILSDLSAFSAFITAILSMVMAAGLNETVVRTLARMVNAGGN